mgnify:CR=1 FL=1
MQLQQGDLVLLKGTSAYGIIIRVASESLFEADKVDSLVNVLWHGNHRSRWVMSSSLAKVNV